MSKVFTITEGLENMGALRTGGQGSVYKGRRYGPVITAVKLLPTPVHTESTADKNFISFQNEVEKLKKVNEEPNPNVVKILNSGITESGSFPFIEMEFIDGPDLEELLREPHEKIFTVKEVIRVADHLANALAHCHRVGVKHGDIKSNNIKLNLHTGNYVLLDFGLSAMSDEQRRTSIRHAGAIEFMAPEQGEGQLLMETDIYSYGIILYELIAGQVPFPLTDNGQKSRNDVLIGHMELSLPDMLVLRQENMPEGWSAEKRAYEMQVPVWLLNVVYKCLEKIPGKRFANGVILQEAILQSSITAAGSGGGNAGGADLLQQENERLQNLVLHYQESAVRDKPEREAGVVVISKPVFFVLALGVTLMAALLSYFLIFKEPARTVKKGYPGDSRPAPDTSVVNGRPKGYAWDNETDSVSDTGKTEVPPVQLKPVPPSDTTVMDLDTTVHF
jgi:serine/threonine protein kinase